MISKRVDWEGWLSGWWVDAIKAITGSFIILAGSNGMDKMGLPGVGIDWKQALGICAFQFLFATAKYFNLNPKPTVITETVDTTHITRNDDGSVLETGTSKTVTTTPIENKIS